MFFIKKLCGRSIIKVGLVVGLIFLGLVFLGREGCLGKAAFNGLIGHCGHGLILGEELQLLAGADAVDQVENDPSVEEDVDQHIGCKAVEIEHSHGIDDKQYQRGDETAGLLLAGEEPAQRKGDKAQRGDSDAADEIGIVKEYVITHATLIILGGQLTAKIHSH